MFYLNSSLFSRSIFKHKKQAFSLLEHTVFLDDSRLEPFESRNSKTDKYESRCGETTFKNWMQKQFFGFSNQQDNDSTEMIPERFKIDAFLILIDVSKEWGKFEKLS